MGLVLGIRVINGNILPIHLKTVEYEVSADGERVGHGRSLHSTVVPARDSELIHLNLELEFSHALGVIWNPARLERLPEMELTTGVRASVFGIPVSRNEQSPLVLD